MTDDREPFEDDHLISEYSIVAAPVSSEYRDRLRRRLRSTPTHHVRTSRFRFLLPTIRRPATAILAASAVILASVTAVLTNQGAQAVSARTLLIGAAANTRAQPYTGTLVTSSTINLAGVSGIPLPPGTFVEGATEQRVIHFSVRDRRHFRISIGWKQPAIDAGAVTFVANGGPLLVYDDRGNLYSSTPSYDLTVFDLAGGSPLSGGSFAQFQSFQSALDRLARSTGGTAQIVGHDTVAGRQTDIVSLQGANFKPVRVWIDHNHPFILKWEQADSAQILSPGSFTAQVLSIAYGAGPTASSLRFQPPEGAANVHREICINACSSGLNASNNTYYSGFYPGYFRAPAPASLPAKARKHMAVYLSQETFMLKTAPPAISYGNPTSSWNSASKTVLAFPGPYVYIQERIHIHGLPSALKLGVAHHAKRCAFWIGALPDGRHTLALQSGHVSVSVHTNTLSTAQLATYARSMLCALPRR